MLFVLPVTLEEQLVLVGVQGSEVGVADVDFDVDELNKKS